MAKFTDLPQVAQIGIVVVVAAAGVAGFWWMKVKPVQDANGVDLATLKTKTAEVAQLSPYEDKLTDLNRQVESLKQQLELQKRIVPDEKEVPNLITLMQGEAQKANIDIRRYTLKPTAAHEFYSEQPVEIDVDGAYYSVLDFFQRLSQTERIINVNGLSMAGLKGGASGVARGVKKAYKWNPNETVSVNCTAITFYSTAAAPPAAAKGAKK
jgi:type IV pilus assembly protein PilO